MDGLVIAIMAGLVLLFASFARVAQRANLTAPMLSILAGAAVHSAVETFDIRTDAVHIVAEITLILILFHDASTVKLSKLRLDPGLPVRLLAIGFPLTIVATYFTIRWLLPEVPAAAALLLAAAISPTDAGLGAPTVLNPIVPVRVRRALNVESGLNDGLATPVVLLALSALAAEEGTASPTILQVGLVPVVLALASCIPLALACAWLVDRSRATRLGTRTGRTIAITAVPILLFGTAELVGANAFIAAFVGGLVFGAACTTIEQEPHSAGLLETTSDLLGFVVWFLAGGLLLPVLSQAGFRWQWVVIAVLALTALRMIPVAVSLAGTRLGWQTVSFIGWFGPRGLATIVFALLAVEELGADFPELNDVIGVISLTVLFSVFAHGLSAGPLAQRFGAWAQRTRPAIEQEVGLAPVTGRGLHGGQPDLPPQSG